MLYFPDIIVNHQMSDDSIAPRNQKDFDSLKAKDVDLTN